MESLKAQETAEHVVASAINFPLKHMLTTNQEKVIETFNVVRECLIVGRRTGSYVDECMTDRELTEQIMEYYRETPNGTPNQFHGFMVLLQTAVEETQAEMAELA